MRYLSPNSPFCNIVFRQGFFPPQWKIAQIIMIQKPVKPAELVESYRAIITACLIEIIRKTSTAKAFRNSGKAKNNPQSSVWIPT